MSLIKSFLAVCAVSGALAATVSPAAAFYDNNGNVVWVIYYPDGTVVI